MKKNQNKKKEKGSRWADPGTGPAQKPPNQPSLAVFPPRPLSSSPFSFSLFLFADDRDPLSGSPSLEPFLLTETAGHYPASPAPSRKCLPLFNPLPIQAALSPPLSLWNPNRRRRHREEISRRRTKRPPPNFVSKWLGRVSPPSSLASLSSSPLCVFSDRQPNAFLSAEPRCRRQPKPLQPPAAPRPHHRKKPESPVTNSRPPSSPTSRLQLPRHRRSPEQRRRRPTVPAVAGDYLAGEDLPLLIPDPQI
jgi:hypothetical protein